MDVVAAMAGYVTKIAMQSDDDKRSYDAKMKILILDTDTMASVSTSTTQSSLLAQGVYLVDRLDNNRRDMLRHLRCLCFLRPSQDSLRRMLDELRDPRYGEYCLYFTNIISKDALKKLAEADSKSVVKAIHEYYGDFTPINSDLFCLDNGHPRQRIWGESPNLWNMSSLQRCRDGLISVLLSLKKKPLVRYQRDSALAKTLATEVSAVLLQEAQLFSLRAADTPPILLIVDRRHDPITPLLTQWTYQAMVHELLGIDHGKVDLKNVPGIRKENSEVLLTAHQDPFFKKSMYLNFGDLGNTIKEYVEQYQSKTKGTTNIESVSDMKRFVEDYPEFRKLSGNVSKHVALVGELSRRVGVENLLDISELEQNLVNNDNHSADQKLLQSIIRKQQIRGQHKIRLAALYALRYDRHPASVLPALMTALSEAEDIADGDSSVIPELLDYHRSMHDELSAGTPSSLFESSSIFSGARDRIKGLKGAENVYTQHSPRLESTLQNLLNGRLKEQQYPFIDGGDCSREKPQDVIVFIVGGATYEEGKMIAQINASLPQVRVVLGATSILNSTAFLADVSEAVSSWT